MDISDKEKERLKNLVDCSNTYGELILSSLFMAVISDAFKNDKSDDRNCDRCNGCVYETKDCGKCHLCFGSGKVQKMNSSACKQHIKCFAIDFIDGALSLMDCVPSICFLKKEMANHVYKI